MKKLTAVILFTIVFAFFLTGGCAGSRTPEKVIISCWKALQKGDVDKALAYMSEEYRVGFEENLDEQALSKEMLKDYTRAVTRSMSLEVTGETIEDDIAFVYVTVTEPDPAELLELYRAKMLENMTGEEFVNGGITMEEAMLVYIEALGSVETKKTSELVITLIVEEGRWKIDGNVIPTFNIRLEF